MRTLIDTYTKNVYIFIPHSPTVHLLLLLEHNDQVVFEAGNIIDHAIHITRMRHDMSNHYNKPLCCLIGQLLLELRHSSLQCCSAAGLRNPSKKLTYKFDSFTVGMIV